jgi:hypothetical protein
LKSNEQLPSALELLGEQYLESIKQLPNGLALEEEQYNFGNPWPIVHWLKAEHAGMCLALVLYLMDR